MTRILTGVCEFDESSGCQEERRLKAMGVLDREEPLRASGVSCRRVDSRMSGGLERQAAPPRVLGYDRNGDPAPAAQVFQPGEEPCL